METRNKTVLGKIPTLDGGGSRSAPNSRDSSPHPSETPPTFKTLNINLKTADAAMKKIAALCDMMLKKSKSTEIINGLKEILIIASSPYKGKTTTSETMEILSDIKKTLDNQVNKLDLNAKEMKSREEVTHSYATVVSLRSNNKVQQIKNVIPHTLMIRTTDEARNSEEIEGILKKNINLKHLKMGINSLKKTSKKSVIVKFDNVEDKNIMKREVEKVNDLIAVEEIKRNPLIVFRGIVKGISETELNECLNTQNSKLKLTEPIKIKYKKRHRNSLLSDIVCQVSPVNWRALTNIEIVYIGYQRIRVEDISPLIQCFKCLKFGHIHSSCSQEHSVCAFCAQNHDSRECKKDGVTKVCVNCRNHKRTEVEHSAFDYRCPIKKNYDSLVRERTNYLC
jgi:hypothetical protein